MSLFGSRMVCKSASYKHVQERKKREFERESKLADWYKEKAERKEKLRIVKERLRQGSVCSTASISTVGSDKINHDKAIITTEQGSGSRKSIQRKHSPTPSSVASSISNLSLNDSTGGEGEIPLDTTHIVGDGDSANTICSKCAIQ